MALTFTSKASSPRKGLEVKVVQLVTDAGAIGNGEWFDTRNAEAVIFDVAGITTATVSFYVSNEPTIPANTDHERTLATALTADGFAKLDRHQIGLWSKARVSAWTSGTVNVWAKIWYRNERVT